ncbi:Branched-chain amino acid transport ATP-binding protein LivG [Rhodococcus wratislaviensis]|uniref:Branched-chain amino acid transport ATP-binding protein LivG n=1 Tax=Rhodococcus wratislaviensis TaxID=44752 RepID=A0A402CG86_RHOWR|nr:branched-chain amino acid ABC transporter permease/ATP-binding protein [Rhodococcus wratislaviensis]GCE42574.1 Branched-chain amino acid transport ATP-binding protein LivG [Rhodococcus wratislaviensis]
MIDLLGYGVLSLGTAALYAFLAIGIVLIRRGSGVLNFAQGALLMFAAYFFNQLSEQWNIPTAPAAVLTIAITGLIGLLFHVLVMRPLRNSTQLNRVIATLGLAIILQASVGLVFGSDSRSVPTVLPDGKFTVFGQEVGADILIRFVIISIVASGLWAFFRYTTRGLATTAVAENPQAASTIGWSPDAVAGASWFAGAGLAGLAGVLMAPLQNPLSSNNLLLLIVPALAVALFAGFVSFPLTILAAFVIALIELEIQVHRFGEDWSLKGLDKAVPVVAIVLFLIWRGRSIPERGHLSEERPMLGTGRVNVPALIIGTAIVLVLIWFVLPPSWLGALTLNAVWALLLLSVVVLVGYAGQLSLGQVAFAGIAALVSGRLVATQDWPLEWALLAGVIAVVPVGILFALPALRARGLQLAVVTLGMSVAIDAIFFQRTYYSPAPEGAQTSIFGDALSKPEGTVVGEAHLFGIPIDKTLYPERYATFVLIAFLIAALAVASMRRGRVGRRLIAVRTNERAAASIGVSIFGAKLYAFALSAGIAGLGGVLFAFQQRNITYGAGAFAPFQSVLIIAFAVVGGIGYITGSFAGAMLVSGALGSRIGSAFSTSLGKVPWLSRLIGTAIAAIAGLAIGRAIQRGVGHLPRYLPWIFLAVFAGSGIALGGRMQEWLTNLDRYLPLIGGVVVILILMQPGGRGIAGFATAQVQKMSNRGRPTLPDSERGTSIKILDDSNDRPQRVGATTSLVVKDLTVRFGNVRAVDNVSLSIRSGEIVGLIGPNGAGKTTTVDAITGYSSIASGQIRLGEVALTAMSAHKRARAGVSRSFQNLELFEDLTVLENIRAASDTRDALAYVTNLVTPGNRPLTQAAVAAIRVFDLEHDLNRPVRDLSYGRRRLVAIARAVATAPSILLLDEPAAGLDEHESAELAALTRRLANEWGLGILLIEHDMAFVMDVCDRVTVLDFGRQIASGTPAQVQSDPVVLAAYLGDESNTEPVEAETTTSVGAR